MIRIFTATAAKCAIGAPGLPVGRGRAPTGESTKRISTISRTEP